MPDIEIHGSYDNAQIIASASSLSVLYKYLFLRELAAKNKTDHKTPNEPMTSSDKEEANPGSIMRAGVP